MEFRVLRPTLELQENKALEEKLEIFIESRRADEKSPEAEREIIKEEMVKPLNEDYKPMEEEEMNAIWESCRDRIP